MQPGSRNVIITCAVTGNASFNPRHPAFPVSPVQIAAACLEAAKAGAAVVHIHVRDPKTTAGSRDPRLFKEVVDRVRDSGADVIINLTAGLGAFLLRDPNDESRALPESDVASVDERVEHLEEDNLYLRKGVFASNGDLVGSAKALIEWLGYGVATPAQARAMLGLGAAVA